MLFFVSIVAALNLVPIVGAQSSTTGTSSAPAATHTVSVGADGHNYTPRELVDVPVGDIIEFRFYPQNHSVARAAFGNEPCIPYELTGTARVGFWSGFMPTALVTNNPPIYRLRINDTEPVFFYCSAPNACFEGMIGVVNPNSTFTLAAQLAYTHNATLEFSPMEYFPAEVKPTTTRGATSSTASPSSSSTSHAATTSAAAAVPASSGSSSSLGTGPIIGIAIGGFAVVVLAGALLYMCGRQKTVTEILNRQSMATSNHTNHNSYMPSANGMSEAHYPNKTPGSVSVSDGRFSGYGPTNGSESYRSMSPPIDERTGFMPMQHHGLGMGVASPPGSPGYPSPLYESHEMDNAHSSTGLSPYHPSHPSAVVVDQGPHEMGVPSRNASAAAPPSARPFSYTDSEADFSAESRQRDTKSETGTY